MTNNNYDQNELNRAQNLATIGLLGFFIPVIGLLLGIIALITVNGTGNVKGKLKKKKNNVTIISMITIILSLASATGYFLLYRQNQEQEQARIEKVQKAAEEEKQIIEAQQNYERSQEAIKTTQLNECLNTAEQNYNVYLESNSTDSRTNSDGSKSYLLSDYNQKIALEILQSDKDECYRRYQ